MLYRIHTESTGPMRQRAIDITATTFDGFTIIDTVGYWQGTREDSMIIEVYTDSRAQVYAVAEEIRRANNQHTVCVAEIDATVVRFTLEG